MQFTKLRLVGFKSFVEAQEFVIERGLTGVVGPNDHHAILPRLRFFWIIQIVVRPSRLMMLTSCRFRAVLKEIRVQFIA